MYWKDSWYFRGSIEHEFKYIGNYGAKGEKRGPKKKVTPEQIKKQNQRNRENNIRRLIKANFTADEDMWCCLKYPKGTVKETEEYKADLKECIDKMRYEYKKVSEPFKFIYRMEVGEKGGVHIHILLNRLRGNIHTDKLLQKIWKHGRVNYQTIYEAGGYADLAEYIAKLPDEEETEQLELFPEEKRKHYIKYSTSRNLVRPKPERKIYKRWTLRKLIEEGPTPTPGYYIDKNSIVSGTNQYTGMSYFKYTENLIQKKQE